MPAILSINPSKMHKIRPKINPLNLTAINNLGDKTNQHNALDTKIKALNQIYLIQRHRIDVDASKRNNI
jgi:hypothetical protein